MLRFPIRQTLATDMTALQAASAHPPVTSAAARAIPLPERITGTVKAAEDSADSDDLSDGALAPPLDGTSPIVNSFFSSWQ